LRRAAGACAAVALLGACATAQLYQGAPRPAGEIARIDGDPRFSAGLPLAALIRKVDDQTLGIAYAGIALEPGSHRLLVDCILAATHTTTRFELNVEVEAGRRYALVADPAPGNQRCGAVRMESR
jgi:hypothetical protein